MSDDAETPIVLVVDDEPLIRDMATAVLESRGYRVLTATTGRLAVDLLETFSSRVAGVVLDLNIPNESAEATYEAIRRLCPGVRVILSTGGRDAPATEWADRPRVFLLPKPYRPQDLLDLLA